jgi:DnaJ family protein A protein 2
MAIKHHPDKGGDEHTFKEINAAYEILSDPEKRSKYDKYGLDGLEEGAGGASHDDLFSTIFGGGGGSRRSAGPRRGEDVNHPLKVSLEDLYNGKTVKLAVSRQVVVGDAKMCPGCDGQGAVLELRQIALGMVQQIQRRCPQCGGEGYLFKAKKEREVLEVLVEKGMKHNQKIVFRGKADEKPNMEPGNINFVVQEKEHALFKRKGADLLISKTLTLNEALCGFEWKITHLDNREIIIKSKPGEVIKAETSDRRPFVKIVAGEGMPSHGNPFVKGNLYVLFAVEFPDDGDLSPDLVEALRKLLPGAAMSVEYDPETAEVVHMDHADVKNFGKGGASDNHGANYDSDEEEGGPKAVQCNQS